MKAVFLPNSQFTQLPWDYLHPNHAGYNATGLVVGLEAEAGPRRRGRGPGGLVELFRAASKTTC